MIGIVDSGIGGVTVLKEILKQLPNQEYVYLSDSKNNPYGEKDNEQIKEIMEQNISYLKEHNCNTIVIACNTASSVCAETLRKNHPELLIIAIEPAVKVVYDQNASGNTIVMATPATISSPHFSITYEQYKTPNMKLVPCPNLAYLIEENQEKEIEKYLNQLKEEYPQTNNIVLGCTHYPLIKKELQKVFGKVNFYDGSIGVSKELKRKLENLDWNKPSKFRLEFFDTAENDLKKERFFKILEDILVK